MRLYEHVPTHWDEFLDLKRFQKEEISKRGKKSTFSYELFIVFRIVTVEPDD